MKKVISAIIALGVIVIPLTILGGIYFAVGVTLISLLAYKELISLKFQGREIPLAIKILGGIVLSFMVLCSYNTSSINTLLDYRMLISLLLILTIPVIFYNDNDKYNGNDALFLIGGILLLGVSFSAITYLRITALKYLIMLIILMISNDTFAQVFGGLIGRNKMIPKISPNKTWEGAIMGSLISTFIASTYYLTLINPDASILLVSACLFLLSLAGQLGDLLFSAIKRLYGIKDYSNIMPGHGGILDRLDSFIFIVLTFMLLINII